MKQKIKNSTLIPNECIEDKIYFIRNKKVMIDRDLAQLYGVTTGNFNKAVKRNIERFPDDDFMFQLTEQEFNLFRSLIFQNGRSKQKRGGARKPSYVFTEQGVAMLSSVLNSKRAIQVNIQIIKTFTRLRKFIANHEELRKKIEQMERQYDKNFQTIFQAIKLLLKEDKKPKREIGFIDK